MAELAGSWMSDHKVKFIRKHVPTKVIIYLSLVCVCMCPSYSMHSVITCATIELSLRLK